MNLASMLDHQARRKPGHPAILDGVSTEGFVVTFAAPPPAGSDNVVDSDPSYGPDPCNTKST